jgi:hypothetical protein
LAGTHFYPPLSAQKANQADQANQNLNEIRAFCVPLVGFDGWLRLTSLVGFEGHPRKWLALVVDYWLASRTAKMPQKPLFC